MVKQIPNAITALRFIGGPALAYWFLSGRVGAATMFFDTILILFLVLIGTDWLDGFLARRLGAENRFGALLDPLADKALVWPFFFIFAFRTDLLGRWIFIPLAFLALFDTYSTLRRFIQWGVPPEHVRANRFGKLKTVASYGAVLCLLSVVSTIAFAFEMRMESGPAMPRDTVQGFVFFSALGMTLAQILIVVAALLALLSILRQGLRRIPTQS